MLSKIQEDLKKAQLVRDEVSVATLRMLISEVKNTQIQKGRPLEEWEIISVVNKEAKKRKESITSFRQGGREELALREEAELRVLEMYLPSQISNEELTKIVKESINELGVTSIYEMGKVMSSVMGKIAGRADGGMVSQIVKETLG